MAAPTRYHGKNAKCYVSGYEIQRWLKKIKISLSGDNPVDSTIGQEDQTRTSDGLIDGSITYDGVLDDTAGAISEILHGLLGDESIVWSVFPGGDSAVGDIAYCMWGIENEFNRDGQHSDVVMFDGSSEGDGGPQRCVVHNPLSAKVATGNGTSVDNGAATTTGGAAYIQCTAVTAPTSLIVIIQGSTTGAFAGEETTIATFTTITAAHSSERIEISGTIPRYTRAKWTIVGTSFTFSVTLHRGE